MDNHTWIKVSASLIATKSGKSSDSKTQVLWYCPRCHLSTIITDGIDANQTSQLYSMDPQIDDWGVFIQNPEIRHCDTEIVNSIMES